MQDVFYFRLHNGHFCVCGFTLFVSVQLFSLAEATDAEALSAVASYLCDSNNHLCVTAWSLCSQVTVNMFYYQRQQTELVPLGYHNLEMTCRSLEPGEPYLLYVLSKRRPEQRLQVFAFQEYVPQFKG